MKWLYIAGIVCFCSCSGNYSSSLSADQQALFSFSDNFRKECRDTTDSFTRRQLLSQYEIKLQDYLTHSRASILDSIRVKMKKLDIYPEGKLFVEFADEYCSYTFHREYGNEKEMKADTVYRLVQSIDKDKDVKLRFLCTGNVKINDPANTTAKNFEIDVVPTAIKI